MRQIGEIPQRFRYGTSSYIAPTVLPAPTFGAISAVIALVAQLFVLGGDAVGLLTRRAREVARVAL